MSFSFKFEYVFDKKEKELYVSLKKIVFETYDRWPLLTKFQQDRLERINYYLEYSKELKQKEEVYLSDEYLGKYIKLLQLNLTNVLNAIDKNDSSAKDIIDITSICMTNYNRFENYVNNSHLTDSEKETIKNNYKAILGHIKSTQRIASNRCYAESLTSKKAELALLIYYNGAFDDFINTDDDKYYSVVYSDGSYEKMDYESLQRKFKTGVFSSTRDKAKLHLFDLNLESVVGGIRKR